MEVNQMGLDTSWHMHWPEAAARNPINAGVEPQGWPLTDVVMRQRLSFHSSINGEGARPCASGGQLGLYKVVCTIIVAAHTTAIPAARAMKMPS
jgi:hypothetical protein